jgi:glycosyltransferase involved in cell wall biosynthesis
MLFCVLYQVLWSSPMAPRLELTSPLQGDVLGSEVPVVIGLAAGSASDAGRKVSICATFDGAWHGLAPLSSSERQSAATQCMQVALPAFAIGGKTVDEFTLFVGDGFNPGTHTVDITLRFVDGVGTSGAPIAASAFALFDVVVPTLARAPPPLRAPRCRAGRRLVVAAWGSLRYGGQQVLALAQATYLPRACFEYHYLHAEALDSSDAPLVALRPAFEAAGALLRRVEDFGLRDGVSFSTLDELLAGMSSAHDVARARAFVAWLGTARVDILVVPNTRTTQCVALLALAAIARVPIRVLELPNRGPSVAALVLASVLVAPSRAVCAAEAEAAARGVRCVAIPPVALDIAAQLPRCAGDADARLACARDGTVIVGFVGRFAARKAPGLFLRVAAAAKAKARALADADAGAHANVRLHFVVVGGGAARGLLMEHATSLGLREGLDTTFVGARFPSTPALSTMDIFVNPSAMDTFGIATVEALAAGASVVACDFGPTPEIVTNGRNGILVQCADPGDAVERLADAVVALARNATRRGVLALQGRLTAVSRFSSARFVERHVALYAELVLEAERLNADPS